MNNPTLEDLLEDWKEERIGAKEAIDQLLRHLRLLHEQLRVLECNASARPAPPTPPPAPASAPFGGAEAGRAIRRAEEDDSSLAGPWVWRAGLPP